MWGQDPAAHLLAPHSGSCGKAVPKGSHVHCSRVPGNLQSRQQYPDVQCRQILAGYWDMYILSHTAAFPEEKIYKLEISVK